MKPTEAPTRALVNVSLHVERGEIVGLLGPNGAGKTTLLKTMATLVVPDGGEGRVAGHSLEDEDGVRRSIGLVNSEERSFYWRLSGRENLRFFASMYGLSDVEVDGRLKELSRALHLDTFIDRRFDAYSSGMKQRLALARAVLHRPAVLLLDEPTRSVDPVESMALRSTIADLVREEGTGVLLVTHNLREVEALCQRVLVLREGRLVFQGSLAGLRRSMKGTDRYVLELAEPVGGWSELSAVAGGSSGSAWGRAELTVDVAEGACIGEVISGLHSMGGRVETVRAGRDTIEQALERLAASGEEIHVSSTPPPAETLPPAASESASRLRQVMAFLRRDLRVYLSYRFGFAVGLFGVLFNVAVFFYLSQFVAGARVPGLERYGAGFFPFILIGIAFRGYLGVGLLQFANALRSEQMMGTLEMLLASPLKVSTFLIASSGFTFLSQTLTVAAYLLVGLVMGSLSLGRMNLPVAVLIMIPTIASFAAIGMLSAAFLTTFKRGDPVNFFLNAGATLFGGVFFPVDVLPSKLQVVSKMLPITYSLEAMRKTLLAGAGLKDVGAELLALTGFAFVLVPAALLVFGAALKKAKRDGTLGQF